MLPLKIDPIKFELKQESISVLQTGDEDAAEEEDKPSFRASASILEVFMDSDDEIEIIMELPPIHLREHPVIQID